MVDEEGEEEQDSVTRAQYRLSFSYTFEYDDDIVFFSHYYPYTYKDLKFDLNQASAQYKSPTIMRIDNLCNTLAGNLK